MHDHIILVYAIRVATFKSNSTSTFKSNNKKQVDQIEGQALVELGVGWKHHRWRWDKA